MIDLHCHVLPGIDDGASSLDEAVEMCRIAAADGCRAIVATPHQRHPQWPNENGEALEASLEVLRDAVGDQLALYLGAEVRVDSELLGVLDDGPPVAITSMAGGRYLLLELPSVASWAPPPEELVHELGVSGWWPILAHPELISYLAGDLPRLDRLVAGGALLQVTAQSVTGELGRQAQRATWQMLEAGLVHFVASDAHGARWRPPGLVAARELVSRKLGASLATRLTSEHPARVLEDRPLQLELEPRMSS